MQSITRTTEKTPPETNPEPFADMTKAELFTEARRVIAEADGWPVPTPLSRPVEGSETFPVSCLGPVLSEAAQTLHNDLQAPVEIAAGSLLAASALAAQGHTDVHMPDGRRIPSSLFILTVAESGDRKSAVDRVVLREHARWMHDALGEWACSMRAYEIAHRAWAAARKRAENNKDVSSIISAMQRVGQEPARPPAPVIMIGNATTEGIIKSLANDWPTAGLFNDEAGVFLGGYSLKDDQELGTISTFSKLWDGAATVRVRGGDGTQAAYGRRLSVHLMGQPAPVRLLLGNEMAHAQGFLPRFLISWPKTMRGTRFYKPANPEKSPAMQRYFSRIVALLETSFSMNPETREITPRPLCMSAEALSLYAQFADTVEADNGPDGGLDVVAAWAAKAGEHALRLAAVLTLVDNENAQEIAAEHMADGIGLATYYLSEMLRLRSEAGIPPDVVEAEKLFRWMLSTGKTELSAHEIMNKGPVRTAARLEPLLAMLQHHHWIHALLPTPGQGRPAKTWRLNPHASR